MAKGWIVVRFEKGKGSRAVAHFWEKSEAVEHAEELNRNAPEGVWYGWEMNR